MHELRGLNSVSMKLPLSPLQKATLGVGLPSFPYSTIAAFTLLSMAFPRALNTKAMNEFAAEYYELPELPQVIFYAILLNEAEKLGVLHGPRLRSLEVALTELRRGAFEPWMWLFSDRVYEARFCPKRAGLQGERETFIWHWTSASCPPRPLPKDFHVLCPCFSLVEAEAAAAESELPEIVQAIFYAMLLNETLELGMAHEYTAVSMKSSLVGLRWSTFEVWMHIMGEVIRGAQLYRPPKEVDVQGARDGQGEGSGSAGPPAPSSDEE
ncbi:hypothetical protein Cgig2_025425 [Carnegiea gigantea]|uniref:Uncharacterized protein n=1 Tax=Carnegiea gigantea TaxID=171969 RepID=A0A9Q1K0Y8_9CARY|nr:hypothetical protein Cgig2_025425 [Carnegiea gigantea]